MSGSKLLGVCGLYCGACPHHRALFEDGKHLLENAFEKGLAAKEFTCEGCGAEKG